jgi:hypothetical protein
MNSTVDKRRRLRRIFGGRDAATSMFLASLLFLIGRFGAGLVGLLS